MSDANHPFLSNSIYTVEKDHYGHTIVLFKHLDNVKPSKELKADVTDHIIKQVADALEISRRYGNHRSYVHVYTDGCMLQHYSTGFYKKLFQKLDELYEDTLEAAYIYDLPAFAQCAWDVLKLFIEPVTRKKIHMVSSKTNA